MYQNLMHIQTIQPNEELKAKGFITIAGRVNRQYFYEKALRSRKGGNVNAGI